VFRKRGRISRLNAFEFHKLCIESSWRTSRKKIGYECSAT
jgi:hypothetical protein